MTPFKSLVRFPNEIISEELPELSFNTVQEALDFLVARGMLDPQQTWDDLAVAALTERTADGLIKLSFQACQLECVPFVTPTDAEEFNAYLLRVHVDLLNQYGWPLPGEIPEA